MFSVILSHKKSPPVAGSSNIFLVEKYHPQAQPYILQHLQEL